MDDPTKTTRDRMASAYARMAEDTLRRAVAGDDDAAYAVIWLVLGRLQSYSLPPKPLHDFFLKVVNEPARYTQIMSRAKPPKRRGRPSIDDKRPVSFPPGIRLKKFFGRLPTEKNALMVAYLLSQGYLINESGKHRESAVQVLSELIKRSQRALQADYYKHKDKIQTQTSLDLGGAIFNSHQFMQKNYGKSKGNKSSQ